MDKLYAVSEDHGRQYLAFDPHADGPASIVTVADIADDYANSSGLGGSLAYLALVRLSVGRVRLDTVHVHIGIERADMGRQYWAIALGTLPAYHTGCDTDQCIERFMVSVDGREVNRSRWQS